MAENHQEGHLARLREWIRKTRDWVRTKVPPGLRSIAGLVLISGGIVGFLPILGYWMIPLGILFIWVDIASLLGGTGKNKSGR